MSIDISEVIVTDTVEIHLRGPDGERMYTKENLPVSVTVYGISSKRFAAEKSKSSNRALERLRSKGKFNQSAEDAAEERASFLTACTYKLNNFTYKGSDDAEAIKAMYMDPKMGWITNQIDEEMSDWSNFSKPSPTN
jgi:hypothetical protein